LELLLKRCTVRMKKGFSSLPWALALAATCAADTAFGDSVDWPTLGFVQVATNIFSSPTSISHPGDGTSRLFVEEQKGRIWIIQGNAVLVRPFLDISDSVRTGAEQGLLGLAFPPGSSTKTHFYVDYTRKPDGATVISRFSVTDDPDIADTNSEQVVMVIPQPYSNHNGGQIAFGPDGYLYVGTGDGGSERDP